MQQAFQTFAQLTWMGEPAWMWLVFGLLLLALLVVDLGVVNRHPHKIRVRESLITTCVYIALACAFGAWLWWRLGEDKGLDFYTGYVVELSLSVDNVFVIAMILGYFKIPAQYQHKVLFWGIVGVLLLRGIMIVLGVALLNEFEFIFYLFGAFLVYSGFKMGMAKDHDEIDLRDNRLLHFLETHMRVSKTLHEDRFFMVKANRHNKHVVFITPLMLALIMVELVDVLFAVDSIPAIFAITRDPFIVLTSNVFAVIGLRSLYFALSAVMERFSYMKYALAGLLVLIGLKMIVSDMLGWVEISSLKSLAMTVAILAAGMSYSVIKTRKA